MVETVTRVLSFGEDTAGSGTLIVAEIDVDMHLDDEGNAKSSFLPGEEVFALIHHDPEIKIIRVSDTAGGDLQRIGLVTRVRTQQMTFTHAEDKEELPHIPNTVPTASWYGRSSGLALDGRQLQAAGAPCLGEITYSFAAEQYKYRLPVGIEVAVGEQFPVDLVIEYESK